MKILIVSTYFPPGKGIASLRPYSWAKYWSRMGHDITVLTTHKYGDECGLDLDCGLFKVITVPHTRYYSKIRKKLKPVVSLKKTNKKSSKKYKIIEYFLAYRNKTGILKDQRMPSHLDLWYYPALKRIPKNEKWDMVVTTYSPYIVHFLGYYIKKTNKAKYWIADYRDLWNGSQMFIGFPVIKKIEWYVEKKINQYADCITTVSEPLAKFIYNEFAPKRIEIIQNGFDDEDIREINEKKYFDNEKIRIVYTGTIYPGYRDPSPLFKAIKSLCDSSEKYLLDDLEILFYGNDCPVIMDMARNIGVDKWIKIGGYVNRNDVLRIQRDAHILLFLETDTAGSAGFLTGKLFEYISSGSYIWSIGATDAGYIIEKSGCGIALGMDIDNIRNVLYILLLEREKKIPVVNYDYVSQYTRKRLAEKMISICS